MLRLVPRDVNAVGGHSGCGRGGAVEFVPSEWRERKVAPPEQLSVGGIQAADIQHIQPAGIITGARDEDPIAPQHRRGVAHAGKFNFLIDVCVRDLRRDRLRVADAGAVRPTESRPLLRGSVRGQERERDGKQRNLEKEFDANCLTDGTRWGNIRSSSNTVAIAIGGTSVSLAHPMKITVTPHGGLRMSRIALGCVTFGREIGEAAAFAMLDHAFAHRVVFFDTAAAYGDGASEHIIGKWLASRGPAPGSVNVATKILPPYEPARIAERVDQSLRHLGVATLDLLYLHRWDATAESSGALAALDALVQSGKVRALGASNFNRAQLATAVELQEQHGFERFRVVQNNHNLAVRDVSADFQQFCAEREIAIVTYSPLGAGFLTGKHQRGVEPGSRFELIPGHQDVYFNEAAWQRLARLEAVAARTGHSQAHLALAWALHQPGVASVLVGGRTPAHIEQALAAQAFDDPEIFAELAAD